MTVSRANAKAFASSVLPQPAGLRSEPASLALPLCTPERASPHQRCTWLPGISGGAHRSTETRSLVSSARILREDSVFAEKPDGAAGKLIRRTARAFRRPATCARPVRFRHRPLRGSEGRCFMQSDSRTCGTRKSRLSVAPGAAGDSVTRTAALRVSTITSFRVSRFRVCKTSAIRVPSTSFCQNGQSRGRRFGTLAPVSSEPFAPRSVRTGQ